MKSICGKTRHSSAVALALAMLAAVVLFAGIAIPAQAQTETLLHLFAGNPDGTHAYSGPTLKGPTLYGTTSAGGDAAGDGIVYAINTTTGKETILHTFGGSTSGDGSLPYGGVALDKAGNLYGLTRTGGQYNSGTIYKVTKKGVETILYHFDGGLHGGNPAYVTPVFDKLGNLYGTTFYGGTYGNGTVFKLAPDGTLTTLYSFNSGAGDANSPNSGVALDTKGNLYGTTPIGGASNAGALYEVTAAGVYSILYSFTGGTDGSTPRGPVVYKGGSLYGTTQLGGANGLGTVFKFTPKKGKKAAVETVLHSFAGGADGWDPFYGALVFDKLGNLYGTTAAGGQFPGGSNLGTVYKLAKNGTETILFAFDLTDGYEPYGNVALDTKGNIYTTAAYGGNSNYGTVIKITP
jgi:uncharacterized repeat protein (TIGR03803 family)